MNSIEILPITQEFDDSMASVIRNVLIEYDGNKPGTAFSDDSLNSLSGYYDNTTGIYYIARIGNELMGGCGIGPLDIDEGVCELQKMYILPKVRKKGIGSALLNKCLGFAYEKGYRFCYLETLSNMKEAQSLYQKFGFRKTSRKYGDTGHFTCDYQMIKSLS